MNIFSLKSISLILFVTFFVGPTYAKLITKDIYYYRKGGDYGQYGLHLYGDALPENQKTTWQRPKVFEQKEFQLAKTSIKIEETREFHLMVHQGNDIDINTIKITPSKFKQGIYLLEGSTTAYDSKESMLEESKKTFDIKARWYKHDEIAILENDSSFTYSFHHSKDGGIKNEGNKITIHDKEDKGILLTQYGNFNNEDEFFYKKFAYLKNHGFSKLKLPLKKDQAKKMVRGQSVICKTDKRTGKIISITNLHKAGLIDEFFKYNGNDLGISYKGKSPTIKLWTPTAHSVKLRVFNNANLESEINGSPFPMKETNAIYSHIGSENLDGKFYLFEIEQYDRKKGKMVTSLVTDPYSISLSTNSKFSQIIDIKNNYMPDGWKKHNNEKARSKRAIAPTDRAIYELHVKDFSIRDKTVPEDHRGTFMAFTQESSDGIKHLKQLVKAGITDLHLLPINDFSSVNEDKTTRLSLEKDDITKLYPEHPDKGKTISEVLESMPKGSDKQQKLLNDYIKTADYNWGYDPHHYMVPEGSYSTRPNGGQRILELRKAIKSLHEMGLNVIVDVVYNHTFDNTILDKIVPDYFYRISHGGDVTNDTCCFDTASENFMAEKMFRDSTKKWAEYYKIDGVRFDLMNFLTIDTMKNIKSDLEGLNLKEHGVNGKQIYLYGEGWDFGSLKWLLPNEAATDYKVTHSVNGNDIGTFNPEFRDTIAGKGQNINDLLGQDSWIAGHRADPFKIMSSLRGSINDWSEGHYNQPMQSINYITAHDKGTLFDKNVAKLGEYANLEHMINIQKMTLGFIALSQGVPFFHAGDEILRSKSGDINSYKSTSWFNHLDFTYKSNNWRKGLPPAWQDDNVHAYPTWQKRLLKIKEPTKEQILDNLQSFKEILSIRKDSKLFRLNTASEIKNKLSFPGGIVNRRGDYDSRMIVMKIDDRLGRQRVDPDKDAIYVLFNTSWDEWIDFYDEDLINANYELHPVHVSTKDKRLRSLIDHSLGDDPKKAFTDKRSGKISVPCQTLLTYILKSK